MAHYQPCVRLLYSVLKVDEAGGLTLGQHSNDMWNPYHNKSDDPFWQDAEVLSCVHAVMPMTDFLYQSTSARRNGLERKGVRKLWHCFTVTALS